MTVILILTTSEPTACQVLRQMMMVCVKVKIPSSLKWSLPETSTLVSGARWLLFQCRKQRKKGYPYVLAHCISADAAMAAGIAVDFCKHFPNLRRSGE